MLQVWDYRQKLVQQEVSLDNVDWQFDAIGPQRAPGKRGLEVGTVSCIKIIDQSTMQRASLGGGRLFGAGNGGAAGQRQWLAVLGEHRTLLLDLDAMAFRELSFDSATASKGGRQHPTTCAVVDDPSQEQTLLACALQDEIHLVSTQTWDLSSPLLLKNKKEITHLVACTGRQRGMLVSGSEDGLLLLWDLTKREVAKSSRAHEAGLVSVSYNPGESQLVTSGKEGVIRTWSLPSLEQQWQVRPSDGIAHAVHCRHSALALDALWLFRPDDQPAAWCMRGQAMENRVHEVLRVTKGATGGIKELMVHPLQPHLLVMLTSGALWVYGLGMRWTPSVAVTKTEVQPSRPIRPERRSSASSLITVSSAASVGRADAYSEDRSSHTAPGLSSRSRTGSGMNSDSMSGRSQLHSSGASGGTLPIHWSVEQVCVWLDQIGLGVHRATFLENEVDGRLLLKLTVDEIKAELGVTSGLQAKKIVSKIERLQGASISASPYNAKQQPDQLAKPASGAAGETEAVRHETREAFFVSNQSLLSVKFTASSDVSPHLQCEEVHKHRTLPFPGVTSVAFSASGHYISIFFAENQRYEILKISDMRRLDSGHAIDFKWAQGGTQGGADRYAVLQSHENYKEEMKSAVQSFNAKPQKGIDQLLIQKKCNGDPEDIARFLLETEGLNMQMIGEYLGKNSEFNQIVLRAYINQLDFNGQMVDEAMRTMYACFIPPGESQQIERINKEFADGYVRQNPTVFSNPGNVEFMGFAIMMLNTDLHNPNIEEKRRMKVEQFIRNTRSPDTESDPACSIEACTAIYQRIASNEIKLKTGDESGLFLKAPADSYVLPDNRLGHVVIRSLYQDDTNLVGYVDITGKLGTKIFGGCMIGVERLDSNSHEQHRRGRVLQWYDWQTLKPEGPPVPSPMLIEWDPDMRYCLTAYQDAYYIWTTYPTFRMQSGPFTGSIVAAIWSQGRLLYCTHDAVCCLYPTHADEGPILLAAFDAPVPATRHSTSRSETQELARSVGRFDDSFCPPPERRPPGALALLRVVQEQLIMMTTSNTIISLSLGHQAMRLRQLVVSTRPPFSQNSAEQIMELALALCPTSEHDAVASFFKQGFDEGDPLAEHFGELAMHLPGLSLVGKLRVCLDTHLHSQAAATLFELVQELHNLEAMPRRSAHLKLPLVRHHLLLAHLVVVAASEEAGVTSVATEVLRRAVGGYPEVFEFVSAVASARAAAATGVPLPAAPKAPRDDMVAMQARLVFSLIGRSEALRSVASMAISDSASTPPPVVSSVVNSSPTGSHLAFSQVLPPPATPASASTPDAVQERPAVSRLELVTDSMPAGVSPPTIVPASSTSSVASIGARSAGVPVPGLRSVSTNPFSPAMLRPDSANGGPEQ